MGGIRGSGQTEKKKSHVINEMNMRTHIQLTMRKREREGGTLESEEPEGKSELTRTESHTNKTPNPTKKNQTTSREIGHVFTNVPNITVKVGKCTTQALSMGVNTSMSVASKQNPVGK